MSTQNQIEANQRNAQKPTGSVTETGRETVSQNRTTHGLRGIFRVLPGEDQDQFDRLFQDFVTAEQPVDAIEFQLVRKMAEATWMSARAVRLQEACITLTQTTQQKKEDMYALNVSNDYDRYLRYQAAHDRAYQKASKDVQAR